jgi:hypothetical protein
MKIYTIYDSEGRFWTANTDVPPINSTELLYVGDYTNPRYNPIDQVFYETATQEEINNYKINIALEIDIDYTNQISELLKKHIEKLNLDGIPIPQYAIDERARLRAECNQTIIDLGVTNFTYRKNNLTL